jgi:hypothetical protein
MAMLALFVALSGGAYAAVSGVPGRDGVIHSCFNKKSGAVRVVAAGRRCARSKEASLSWNQTGVKGDKGDAGPKGEKGEKGSTGSPGPITGALPSHVTLRGIWAIEFESGEKGGQRIETAISFGFTLPEPPTPNFIPAGGPVPPGCAGGTPAAPTAQPGNLCVYELRADNVKTENKAIFNNEGTDGKDDAYGAGLAADLESAKTDTRWRGTWAVTAP